MSGAHPAFDLPPEARDLRVLVVEDDEDDLLVLKDALQHSGVTWDIHISFNGQEAISWLEEVLKSKQALPDFILSDIKTPLMDGLDLLQWVRSHPQLKHLKVLFFTSSSLPSDLDRAQKLGVNGYQLKPILFDAYRDIVRSMDESIRSQRPYAPIAQ